MEIKPSSLILKDFVLVRQQFEYIAPKELKKTDFFNQYEIDLDFMIQQGSDKNDLLFFLKAQINTGKKLPGYVIFCECMSVFSFDDSTSFDIEQKIAMLDGSALSMSISQIRTLIASMTAMAPLGKYLIPSVDMNHLINSKREYIKNKPKKKKS
ncbi:MAG: hypothetical protein V4592_18215 [Bacteroidota bacterium]